MSTNWLPEVMTLVLDELGCPRFSPDTEMKSATLDCPRPEQVDPRVSDRHELAEYRETRWSDALLALTVFETAGHHVPMESTDRSTTAILEGLPGPSTLTLSSDCFGTSFIGANIDGPDAAVESARRALFAALDAVSQGVALRQREKLAPDAWRADAAGQASGRLGSWLVEQREGRSFARAPSVDARGLGRTRPPSPHVIGPLPRDVTITAFEGQAHTTELLAGREAIERLFRMLFSGALPEIQAHEVLGIAYEAGIRRYYHAPWIVLEARVELGAGLSWRVHELVSIQSEHGEPHALFVERISDIAGLPPLHPRRCHHRATVTLVGSGAATSALCAPARAWLESLGLTVAVARDRAGRGTGTS